jgi:hypothetical protein
MDRTFQRTDSGSYRAKCVPRLFASQVMAEMALFQEIFAAAGCSQGSNAVMSDAEGVAGACVSGNRRVHQAQGLPPKEPFDRQSISGTAFAPTEGSE